MAPSQNQAPQQPQPYVILCKDSGEGDDDEAFLFNMFGEGEEGEDGDYEFQDEISEDDVDFDDEEDLYGDEKQPQAAPADDEVAPAAAQKRSVPTGDEDADEEAESRQVVKK